MFGPLYATSPSWRSSPIPTPTMRRTLRRAALPVESISGACSSMQPLVLLTNILLYGALTRVLHKLLKAFFHVCFYESVFFFCGHTLIKGNPPAMHEFGRVPLHACIVLSHHGHDWHIHTHKIAYEATLMVVRIQKSYLTTSRFLQTLHQLRKRIW